MNTLRTAPYSQAFSFNFADFPTVATVATPIILPKNAFVVELMVKSNVAFGAGQIQIIDSGTNQLCAAGTITLSAITAGHVATYHSGSSILPMNPGLISIVVKVAATLGQGDIIINYYLLD